MGTASEVTSKDIPPRIKSLPSFPVDVLMIPGVTLWGEINTPSIVVDFDDFFEKHRGYMLNYETPVQIKQFFLGGGRKAIVVRIVHIDGSGNPVSAAKAWHTSQTATASPSAGAVTGSTTAPYALVNGDTLVGKVDSNPGEETATIVATVAELENTPAETYALSDGQTLTVKIDGGSEQTVTFNTAEFADIANATAEEVAAVINAELVGGSAQATSGGTKVTIYSDTAGSNSKVQVTGGTANGVLTFVTTEQGVVGNNVANVSSVTITELKAIIEAAWVFSSGVTVSDSGGMIKITSNTTGASSNVQVVASSTGDDELGLDNAVHAGGTGAAVDTLKLQGKYEGGTIGNGLTYDVTDATDGIAEHFDIVVYLDGVKDRTHANLTMDATSVDYAPERLKHDKNESMLVDAVDMSAPGVTLDRRPANAAGNSLAGGDDGLALLEDNDFIGQEQFSTGLYAFDQVDEGDILICPDRATTTVQNRMSLYMETNRKNTCTGIPDPPLGMDADAAITHVASLTPSEQFQALPWPAVHIPNPDKVVYGNDTFVTIKPSGSIAGKMAGNTRLFETHVATQPGNETRGRLINVINVESQDVRRIGIRRKVTPNGINPIMAAKDTTGRFGVWLNDVQAGKTNGNFKSIGETRVMAAIRKAMLKYLDTIRTTENTQDNRLKDQKIIEAYMLQWVARGALATTNATEAFYVNTDPRGDGINNALVREREEYKVILAVATARARRFVEILFTRDQRAVEAALLQQLVSP